MYFNPSETLHFGGAWENANGRYSDNRAFNSGKPRGRPLTYRTDDAAEPQILTPH